MHFKRPSILRNLFLSCLAFGLFMGLIFPFYANFFVEWKPGMYIWFAIGCIIAGATIGIVNYALVKLILLKKLQRISGIAHAISQKDITHNCEITSHDMIGDIVNSFNMMAANLREIISEINTRAATLNNATSHLYEVTEKMKADALQQQAETDQVATAINQMTSTVQEVSRHADETAVSTSEADKQGNNAKNVINNAMSAVQSLAGNVDHADEVLQRLNDETKNIGSVLGVINDIAEQTNLLALNAAIEAARAGEQGRGFAVVADEVRSLATRTQSSTQEISDIINRLQSEANQAVITMHEGKEHAQNGVEMTRNATSSLNEMVASIQSINTMNTQIATAAREQAMVAEEINRNIVNVNDIATQSVNEFEQTGEDSKTLSDLAHQLNSLVVDFKM